MQFASDSPDLPELLSTAGASGGASTVTLDQRPGLTPDVRAFSPPALASATAPPSATPPSLALSPPTPKQRSLEPREGSDGAPTPATPDVDGASCTTPTDGSVDADDGGVEAEDYAEVDAIGKNRVEVVVDMSTTGDWNGLSTLEKPRETDYDRPAKGWKTSLAKTFGFFFFFGLNAFLIAYLVPMVFKAMLGL